MSRSLLTPPRSAQAGMAALVVVTILFIVTSLAAAYTSRNLIFEQRTSANQYRSTQAIEAAEAGLEWAIAMLNHGRIDANCVTSADVTDTSFRQRYLNINASTGDVSVLSPGGTPLWPTCVFNGTDWVCHCPSSGAPALTEPAGTAFHPAFRVRFNAIKAGIVRIDSNGCTRLDDSCLTFVNPKGSGLEGRAVVSTMVSLASGLANPPWAPLTARGNVNTGATLGLKIYNSEAGTGGITVQALGTVDTSSLTLATAPGTPGSASVVENDTTLPARPDPSGTPPIPRDLMFPKVFNMWPETYRLQPAAVQLDCGVSSCSADAVRTAASLNPGRVLWLPRSLNLDGTDIGTATNPVVLVINGVMTASAGSGRVYGLVYVQAANWTMEGATQVHGAVIADGNVGGTGATELVYDSAILTRLRVTTGSFVRVPGSWKDF